VKVEIDSGLLTTDAYISLSNGTFNKIRFTDKLLQFFQKKRIKLISWKNSDMSFQPLFYLTADAFANNSGLFISYYPLIQE
jgi:hypothetical protein